jgi:hypothetical protein
VDDGPPIRLASLGLMPSIIKTLDEDYLEQHGKKAIASMRGRERKRVSQSAHWADH